MVVDKATALSTERGGRSYYFCSAGCQRTFESPEDELKSMRTRVTIALTGVLALAILRAGAFIALAAGATFVTWVPIPALPWFTWGMWLFLLVTPVQFIGGWSFYVGAWNAIRTRSINMDLLIALGTTVAYFYSVAVLFFPSVLPVKVEERDVYFEVSAVIIAFVLLGKYMEEIIKKRSSAAVRKLLDLQARHRPRGARRRGDGGPGRERDGRRDGRRPTGRTHRDRRRGDRGRVGGRRIDAHRRIDAGREAAPAPRSSAAR